MLHHLTARVVFWTCGIVSIITGSHAHSAEPRSKPNIVIVLADDLGYGDLGCYASASKIPTPHLDRLAAEGMRFTDAHSPSSVCSPTRYALLTGRYAWRTRLQQGVLVPWDPPLIAPDRLTVAALLKQHGYETACVGKWHLGWDWATTDGQRAESVKNHLSNVDFTKPLTNGPITRGFDAYFGTDVPNYPPYCFIENDRTLGIPSAPESARVQSAGANAARLAMGRHHARTDRARGAIHSRFVARRAPATVLSLYAPDGAALSDHPRGSIRRGAARPVTTATLCRKSMTRSGKSPRRYRPPGSLTTRS